MGDIDVISQRDVLDLDAKLLALCLLSFPIVAVQPPPSLSIPAIDRRRIKFRDMSLLLELLILIPFHSPFSSAVLPVFDSALRQPTHLKHISYRPEDTFK